MPPVEHERDEPLGRRVYDSHVSFEHRPATGLTSWPNRRNRVGRHDNGSYESSREDATRAGLDRIVPWQRNTTRHQVDNTGVTIQCPALIGTLLNRGKVGF